MARSIDRRGFLHAAVAVMAAPAATRAAWALDYPTRPVRIVVGFPAGGGQDILARLVAQRLSERLGQPFVVENKPGAATNRATESVVNAAADGHTLIFIGPPAAINATLYHDLKFNFIRDIAPVAIITRAPYLMVVNPAFPAQSLGEFIAYAKSNPGKVTLAGNGPGGGPHMAGELFKVMAGVDMLTVQYRGDAPALTDLMGGQVQVYFASIASALEFARSGRLRPLGVTSATRSGIFPDLPAIGEFVRGYDVNAVFGVGAPKNTPAAVVDALNAAIKATTAEPGIAARLADLGGSAVTGTPAEYAQLIARETDTWAKVIREANIKPE
jgi:tripartite-type tricarboxylate transporter receptor subunit TctC